MFKIKKSSLSGTLHIPPSKSQSLRAILFASLASGKSFITNPLLQSPDIQAMIKACRYLGAVIDLKDNTLEIVGVNNALDGSLDVIQVANSGIVLRFISALAALSEKPIVITGDDSIRHQRPMQELLDALNEMGALAISTKKDGFAPVIIQGPLKKNIAHIIGQDSQFVSALLILFMFTGGVIKVSDPGEKPWVDMTLDWLKKFNVPFINKDYKEFHIKKVPLIQAFKYTVPSDLSSLAFPVAAALVTKSNLLIEDVDFCDKQGDKKLFDVFKKMGASLSFGDDMRHIEIKPSLLKGIDVDINDFIDALPILSTVACFASTKTTIMNAANARNKECDRIKAICQELKKMGANIEEKMDGLIIHPSKLFASSLYSHQDHRIAMSLTVAAMGAEGESILKDSSCVSKTYPLFFDDMKKIGANIET